MNQPTITKPTTFRWTIVGLLFLATTVNYLDRQVLSLTWKDFIAPEFHWDNNDYGNITALFSIFYAGSMIFAGKFVDWMDTKKGFLWAIGVWSVGAVLHAFCGIATSGILTGDWRFYIFSQPNYGLGTDIIPPKYRDADFDLNDIKEPMDYNYFKFHQTVSWEFKNNYYVGAGVHLDWYTTIKDNNLDIDNKQFTNHYNYNIKYNFDYNEYIVNGLSLNLLYDSRDNQINTNHGMFANINFRINPAINQSQDVSTVLYGEYRYFLPLSKFNEQHVFSLWATGQFVTTGNVPYLNLPSIGWDQRSRSGKGYTQGLFRGQKLVYFETEYRFPISCNQLISGTVFANLTTASDKDREIRLFQYIQPAVGVGMRILIDKATRTNLVMNYAWGRHSDAFYLNAGESF